MSTASPPPPPPPPVLTTEAELRALIGEPTPLVCAKVARSLNELSRRFVEASPFVLLATSDATGACDVSPRGDPPGFVRVLDDHTLLLPERPGNRIADSLRNILQNPHVGLLFCIPGVTDSFRVNGRATLITDRALLEPCAVEGKVPKLGIRVEVQEAYAQCGKAMLRSELWNPARHVDRATLPSMGELLARVAPEPVDAAAYDAARAERYARREGMY